MSEDTAAKPTEQTEPASEAPAEQVKEPVASEPTGPETYPVKTINLEYYPVKTIQLEYGEHKKQQTAHVHQHTTVLELLQHCQVPTDGTHAIQEKYGEGYLGLRDHLYRDVKNGDVVKIHRVAKGRAGHGLGTKPVVSGS